MTTSGSLLRAERQGEADYEIEKVTRSVSARFGLF